VYQKGPSCIPAQSHHRMRVLPNSTKLLPKTTICRLNQSRTDDLQGHQLSSLRTFTLTRQIQRTLLSFTSALGTRDKQLTAVSAILAQIEGGTLNLEKTPAGHPSTHQSFKPHLNCFKAKETKAAGPLSVFFFIPPFMLTAESIDTFCCLGHPQTNRQTPQREPKGPWTCASPCMRAKMPRKLSPSRCGTCLTQ